MLWFADTITELNPYTHALFSSNASAWYKDLGESPFSVATELVVE